MVSDPATHALEKLGLPDGIRACLFDLDGVLTDTASVHAAAWKQMFDAFLTQRAQETGVPQRPFTAADYTQHVDGKPRADGVRDFLASRCIQLPPSGNGADTVAALGTRKNALVLRLIDEQGVTVYPGSLRYLQAVRAAGLATAVVSSSANCEAVVRAAGLQELLDQRVDGVTAQRDGIPGKPAPDMFLAGARATGATPAQSAVFEDAVAGVQAGRAGSFGYVIGVDRVGHADALREHGAQRVVDDLADLLGEAGR